MSIFVDVLKYQSWVENKMDHSLSAEEALVKNGLGISGEAGEVSEIIKKHAYHNHVLDKDKMIKELGDVLWYLVSTCHLIGTDLHEVMYENMVKLNKRYPDGFDKNMSINREEYKK